MHTHTNTHTHTHIFVTAAGHALEFHGDLLWHLEGTLGDREGHLGPRDRQIAGGTSIRTAREQKSAGGIDIRVEAFGSLEVGIVMALWMERAFL